ncbi:MAG: endolytic transglycosylase MltG [Actinobacteria bacterium]|nr:endolytic transglycosylase MltG [Actinomycetota bacterium]
MSDDFGKGMPPGGDPLFDANDPAAVEREERRREREAKRAKKSKKKGKAPAPAPPPKPAPPAAPRTPEQEFWDEPAEPAPPAPGQAPGGKSPADDERAEKADRGRRRLLGRRKGKAAAAGVAGAAAGAAAAEGATPPPPPGATPPSAEPAPPTGESPRPGQPPTGESPGSVQPPTGESPRPAQPPTGASAVPPQAAASPQPTGETPRPAAEPRTGEAPIPARPEAPHQPTADAPQVDPGPPTAEVPRPDPGRPIGEDAFPGTAAQAVPGAGPATREHLALPPRPLEETGAGDWEPPPPRDDWFDDDEPFDDEGDPRMAGAARTGRRHGDDGGKRFGGPFGTFLRHPFRVLGVVVAILVLLFLNALFQPFHGEGSGRVAVVIPKGSSVGEVGEILERKGVISGGFIISGSTLFQARVTLAGDRSNLIAGRHVMAHDMSYGDAIEALTTESKPVEASTPGVITVTIPEGQSRPITAALVKEDGIKGSYMKASKHSQVLNPEQYGGKNVKSLEGFLYPDTWEFRTSRPVKDLVTLQLEDFKKKIKKVNMKYAKSKNLTVFDVVTIASMIEREAGVPKQRKLVSSVIYNRLHEGMTLGIDSTIRFATGNYERPLTQSQLESNSPYNTRTHQGLPPGPINSPGLAALNAAAHPANTQYLFYVNNPNSCNELTFAKTEEEFLADAAKYEQAREKNGGNEPSTCK